MKTPATTYQRLDDLPLVVNVSHLAAVLQVSTASAYQLVRSNKIRCLKIGRQYRIPRASIQEYLETAGVQTA